MVLDLYCGAGAMGLTLAKNASKVIGYDSNRGSIRDAQLNAQQNGISNASFFPVDLGSVKGVAQLHKHVPVVDVVIAGMSCPVGPCDCYTLCALSCCE